jgi:hypothetical protein
MSLLDERRKEEQAIQGDGERRDNPDRPVVDLFDPCGIPGFGEF